ncbi:hypothetical protein D3C85_1414730 [compost metagenome]
MPINPVAPENIEKLTAMLKEMKASRTAEITGNRMAFTKLTPSSEFLRKNTITAIETTLVMAIIPRMPMLPNQANRVAIGSS